MNLEVLLILAVGTFVAYANGANDVSKGVATLVGSGVSDYRKAIHWGTAWTAVGGLAAATFAGAMVTTFGSGLLAADTIPTFAAALATIVGAAAWVLLATRTGLPVSTTHAIVGSLAGVAAFAYGIDGVKWSTLGGKIFLPLLLSPVVSLVLTAALLRAGKALAGRPASGNDCVCAELEPVVVMGSRGGTTSRSVALAAEATQFRLVTGTADTCTTARPVVLRLTLDHLHWFTSGATSFARGLNDAPKMVALVLVASALTSGSAVGVPLAFTMITLGMVVGSLVGDRRVTEVLAENVTPMDNRQGFVANLVTAGLVTAGAIGGLPMSTTHVSSSGIIGAATGQSDGALNLKTVRDMLLAWVITLPAAALLGVLTYILAKAL